MPLRSLARIIEAISPRSDRRRCAAQHHSLSGLCYTFVREICANVLRERPDPVTPTLPQLVLDTPVGGRNLRSGTLRDQLGSLDQVQRLVKILGMVNSAPNFFDHPQVINGCSELFVAVWGTDHGMGARSAVGLGPLPGNIAVEIEAIFELVGNAKDTP